MNSLWMKTIDGDFINLETGMVVGIVETVSDYEVHIHKGSKVNDPICACCGSHRECFDYIKKFEYELKAHTIIIEGEE